MKKLACCLVSFLVTILVIVGAVFGAGWYAYDRYAKDITGITYLEAWNVLSSLYGTKEKKVITNSFDADVEFAAVDKELKNLLFIDDSVDFSLKSMIDDIVGVTSGTPNGDNTVDTPDDNNGENPDEKPVKYSDAILGVNELAEIGTLESFINTLKFDFSELKDYNGEQHILTMTDKQIGAILNEAVLGVASKNASGLAEQGVDIQKVFGIREVKIKSDANSLTMNESTVISAVVKLDLRDAVEALLNTYQPKLKFLKGLLPKALYLTLEIKPFGEGLPTVRLNDNNDKENELAIKLVNGILNYSAGTKDVDKVTELFSSVDNTIKETFKQLDGYLNIVFAPSAMNANPLQFLVKHLGVDDVTDKDLLYTISYLMHTADGLVDLNWDETQVTAFFDDFKSKMPIEKDFDLNLNNFTDELSKIGEHIDLNAMDFNKSNEEMKLLMNYDAVAGFIEKMFVDGDDGIMSMLKIRQINMPDVTNAEQDQLIHFVIEVAMREYLNIDSMEDGLQKSLLDAMIHDIYIEATVSAIGAKNDAIGLNVNELGGEKTTHMLKNLDKLISVLSPSLAGEFNEQTLITKIQDNLVKALDSIKGSDETAELEITFTKEGIRMQSIYEIIKTKKNITELSAEDIRLTLKGVMDTDNIKNGIIGEFDPDEESGIQHEMDIINKKITASISDAFIAETVKENVNSVTVAGGGTVELLQVLFADLSQDATKLNNKLWNNDVLRSVIETNNMSSDKVLLVTTKIALKNDVFNQAIYMSIIYDITTGRSALVINDMDTRETNNLAILIEKLSGTKVDFEKISEEVIGHILKATIRINTVITLEITVGDLIEECDIINREIGKLGCGVISKTIALPL